MPRGGARVGAGRKPKNRGGKSAAGSSRPSFVAIDGGRAEDAVTVAPAADLPEDQQDFWRRYAARAIDAGTLTIQTTAAFRLLCELDAEKRATKETIDRDGRTYLKAFVDSSGQEHQELRAHPLTSSYRQLAQRVEALMARFQLAPFGKPIDGAKKRLPVKNPWASIAATKR